MYNHAFRLTGDWSAAEEVMAMTFLEAWRSREQIAEDGGSLRPWLLGIATNLARGQRRAARRQRDALARLAITDYLPDFADDVSGRLDDAARVKALHRALAGLARHELDVLALCVWSGLGYAAAAEALGIPVGTVRSRLSRARATRDPGDPGAARVRLPHPDLVERGPAGGPPAAEAAAYQAMATVPSH